MQLRTKLSLILVGVLPLGALAPACSTQTSSTKQLITCTTDPGTGVILRCAPGAGSDTGGANTCQDIDEDGDGEPHDEGDDDKPAGGAGVTSTQRGDGSGSGSDSDDDHDGVPDDRDCDHRPGEDHEHQSSDLPYDIRPQQGASTRPIVDAFAAKGGQPAAIVSVTMDGGNWRLAELQAGTAFTVTAADCTHAGNRATGRDRVVVTWRGADNATHSDHLDIRYCAQ